MHRVRAAPGAGPRRRPDGVARRLPRRLLRDLERARRAPVRHPRARHARPQLGALVRERAGGVRRLGRRHARQRGDARRHLRLRRGRRERDRHRQADARARPRGWRASGSTRATSPTSRTGPARCSTRTGSRRPRSSRRNDLDPETIESLQAQGARIDVWGVGHEARDLLRPAGAGRRVQAHGDPRRRRVADAGQGQLGHGEDHRPGPARRAPLLRRRRHGPRGHDLGRAQRARRLAGDRRSRGLASPDDDRRRLDPQARSSCPCSAAASASTTLPALADARDHARHELGTLHPAILRQLRPHWYPAGLEWSLHRRRESLIEAALVGRGARRRLNAPGDLTTARRRPMLRAFWAWGGQMLLGFIRRVGIFIGSLIAAALVMGLITWVVLLPMGAQLRESGAMPRDRRPDRAADDRARRADLPRHHGARGARRLTAPGSRARRQRSVTSSRRDDQAARHVVGAVAGRRVAR